MEYATDHVPQNKLPPLKTPEKYTSPAPSGHDRIVAAAIVEIKKHERREPAARAHRLRNYALVMERLASLGGEECAPLLMAAARLRNIADEITYG